MVILNTSGNDLQVLNFWFPNGTYGFQQFDDFGPVSPRQMLSKRERQKYAIKNIPTRCVLCELSFYSPNVSAGLPQL